jgi:magnesium-transporting ATPase (P-type)
MATVHHSHTGNAFIIMKGALEQLLKRCKQKRSLDGDNDLDLGSNHHGFSVRSFAV